MKSLLLFFTLVLAGCCPEKKQFAVKEWTITSETLRFRRSYAGIENMTEKELEAVQDENPILEPTNSLSLVKRLEKVGLIRNNSLEIDQFLESEKQFLISIKNNGFKVNCRFDKKLKTNVLEIEMKGRKLTKRLETPLSPLYFIADLNEDGSKEILALEYTYFMNGDSYYLTVFGLN